jgi:hypothetical protein
MKVCHPWAPPRRAFMAATPPGAIVVRAVRASGEPKPEEGQKTWRLWWQSARPPGGWRLAEPGPEFLTIAPRGVP